MNKRSLVSDKTTRQFNFQNDHKKNKKLNIIYRQYLRIQHLNPHLFRLIEVLVWVCYV